jgi:hypothetical protein
MCFIRHQLSVCFLLVLSAQLAVPPAAVCEPGGKDDGTKSEAPFSNVDTSNEPDRLRAMAILF